MARILIVEDEPNMRKLLALNLRADGHALVQAGTVKDGLEAIDANDFDVILTDQRLPDGEGLEVVSAVAQSDSPTAVVVLTAYGSVELAVETMRKGGFDFLHKPFSAERSEEHTSEL